MSARPRLLRAYELFAFRSTAFSNDSIASLRLPICSCTRPIVFQAPDRFGMRLTAMLASFSALSYCLSSSSLRAVASASGGCGPSSSFSTATGGLGISIAAMAGVSAGGGASIGLGASVVATGAVVVVVGFLDDGERSLQAAMEAVMATAVKIFVNRSEVDI